MAISHYSYPGLLEHSSKILSSKLENNYFITALSDGLILSGSDIADKIFGESYWGVYYYSLFSGWLLSGWLFSCWLNSVWLFSD